MITAEFYRAAKASEGFGGFKISGHSGLSEAGSDICCAAVSSAAELICNALTDFMEGKAEAKCTEGKANALECSLIKGSGEAYRLMNAFYTHLTRLEEDFPDNLKVMVK